MSATFTLRQALEVVRLELVKVRKALTASDAEIASLAVLDQDGQPVADLKDRRIALARQALDEAGNDLFGVMIAAEFVADLRTKITVSEEGIKSV
jgi:hypothetical protein